MSVQAVHQPSESFVKEVHAVAAAEEQARAKMEQATAKAAQIKADAQAAAVQTAATFADKAVAEKNKIVSSNRAAADAEVKKILSRAAEHAKELAGRHLTDSAVSEISDSL